MSTEPANLIASRGEFHAALRYSFEQAASLGAREIFLSDPTFADWPLGERAVVEQLDLWARSNRRLTLVAGNFDDVARRHARWVEWRRHWTHIVGCRINAEIESADVPTLLIVSGAMTVRLSDPLHHRGRFSRDASEELRCKERLDAVLQRSEEAFPATTSGL